MVAIGCSFASIVEIGSAHVSWRTTPNTISKSLPYVICTNFILCQDWFNIEFGILDEGRRSIVIINLKFPVSSSCKSDLMFPIFEIESIELVFEDKLGAG